MATKKKSARRKPARGARKPPAKRSSKRAAPSPTLALRHQPEALRLRSLAASLTVTDLTTSISWYRDVLRFTPGERWEADGKIRGIQMKAGRCDLMLAQDDFAKGRERVKGEGVRLWFSTAQDIAEFAARIKASGVRLDFEPRQMPWGDYAFAITDPDGYKITVIQEE
jgi:uncharacterized glyoxalase superfamily protein PhnB